MKVFEFEKTLLDRLQEYRNILEVRDDDGDYIKASQIRHEWELYAELKMEPAGKIRYLLHVRKKLPSAYTSIRKIV